MISSDANFKSLNQLNNDADTCRPVGENIFLKADKSWMNDVDEPSHFLQKSTWEGASPAQGDCDFRTILMTSDDATP
jgi:hypothetical protein